MKLMASTHYVIYHYEFNHVKVKSLSSKCRFCEYVVCEYLSMQTCSESMSYFIYSFKDFIEHMLSCMLEVFALTINIEVN